MLEYRHHRVISFRVVGDSMDRVAPERSIVVVDYTEKSLSDGELGVFFHGAEATFKRYRIDDTGPWLEADSYNPRHESIFPKDGEIVEVVGRVIDIQPEYRTRHHPNDKDAQG